MIPGNIFHSNPVGLPSIRFILQLQSDHLRSSLFGPSVRNEILQSSSNPREREYRPCVNLHREK